MIMTVDEIKEIELIVDPHAIGSMHESKLVNALQNLLTSYDDDKVKRSLEVLDTNTDGKIPIEEFEYFMEKYGDELNYFQKK